ncbi:hypothetical protein VIGAN_03120500, partial [Vigna angularis var. angularis]
PAIHLSETISRAKVQMRKSTLLKLGFVRKRQRSFIARDCEQAETQSARAEAEAVIRLKTIGGLREDDEQRLPDLRKSEASRVLLFLSHFFPLFLFSL